MDIKEFTKVELEAWFLGKGEKPFRARQALQWLYQRGAETFAAMTDLPSTLRTMLSQEFSIGRLICLHLSPANDGTQKFLFALADHRQIESVLIPADGRLTLCISSQVGCAMGCRFCATAQVRPVRDLTAGEIVSQVWEVQRLLPPGERLTNLVFMGMGEPLANYEQLVKTLTIITAEWGLNFSPRRVTVSTVGLVPQMRQLLEETNVNLTVSLTATTDQLRDELMPVNRRYPLKQLLDTCRTLPIAPRKRITFAYIMLRGVNDGDDDAQRLVKLLHGMRSKVNLIPFNPFPDSPFLPTPRPQVERFRQYLLDRGVHATVRESRGQDVLAACGQLAAGLKGSVQQPIQAA
ncbi:MAG: 23S rRNA (adenine(2503)-C(2))-methyltransferase RlmN [Deltaproteobacteria bacterium]|nr:23S rRNA (adenine(2503)-C(2))-methyltransferase RlmN [Deltaproteobacteria bacterium]